MAKRRMSTKRGRRTNGARKRRANPAGGSVSTLLLVAVAAVGVYLWMRPTEMKAIEF